MRWLLVLLVGCGRVAFDPLGGGVDPTGDGGHLDGTGGGGDDSGGGGGDDAPVADAAPDAFSSVSCGPNVIIMDDFADGQVGGGPWTVVGGTGASVGESGGAARFNLAAGAGTNATAALRQTMTQALDGTCVIAELLTPPTGPVRAYVRIGAPTKYIQIEVAGGIVEGRSDNGGTGGTAGGATYNAANDHFLRVRAIGNRNYAIEAGPTLGSFSMIGSMGGSFSDPSPTFIEVGVVATATNPQATSGVFGAVYFFGP